MATAIRLCWNNKSRTHPDVCCNRQAAFGDFCSFHYKNPRRFSHPVDTTAMTRRKRSRLERFIAFCRLKVGLMMVARQGPASFQTDLANNTSELASMDSLNSIWPPYRFSFMEGTNIWLFDVRSLLTEKKRLGEKPFTNPYTSIPISSQTLVKLHSHVQWLIRRRYSFDCLVSEGLPMNPYLQKIVELCLIIDSYGYLTNVAWFELPTVQSVKAFVDKLNLIWDELSNTTKTALFPTWTPGTALVGFHTTPHVSNAMNQIYTKLIQFVTAAEFKEDRAMTTVYILKALTHVSLGARTAFPWLA